jgi:hypothetical protein
MNTSVGGKPQLLRAIMEVSRADPAIGETVAAVVRSTDPVEVIRLTAAGTRVASERQDERIGVLLASARVDAAAAETLQDGVRGYRDNLDKISRRLEELDAPEATEQARASDVLWYLFGMTSWQTLVKELGWSWDQAEEWLTR